MALLRLIRTTQTVALLGLLFLSAQSWPIWAQQSKAITNPPGEISYPDPLRLADGWWDVLRTENKLNPERLLQWADQLDRTSDAPAEVSTELAPLIANLRELAGQSTPGKVEETITQPPVTLSELLDLIERRYQVTEQMESAVMRNRLDRSLAADVEIRVNQARKNYVDSSAVALSRGLLGWRWIRSWSRQQLVDSQRKASKAEVDGLQQQLDQLQQWLLTPVAKLRHDEATEATWVERATAGEQPGDIALELESLNGDSELLDVARAADLRSGRVERMVVDQALWLERHYRGSTTPAATALTEAPSVIIAWRNEAKRFLDDRRARVISTIENVGGNSASNKEVQRQLEAIRALGRSLRGLAIGLDQQAMLARDVQSKEGWSLKSVGSFWSRSAERITAFTDNSMNRTLFHLNEAPVTGGMLLRMLLIFAIVWGISKLIGRALERLEKRHNISAALAFMFNRVLHYILILFGLLIALSSIGIDLTKFALFASALGIGLGFGLQAVISNFVSGLIILFERSLKINDFVELESGVRGKVREINVRGTIITTNDNIDILVPNSEFVNGKVTNWTLRDVVRRLRIPFAVAYGSDKELVKKAALEASDSVPFTLTDDNHRTQVWLTEFGDSSLNFQLMVWVSDDAVSRPGAVTAAYAWAIETALAKYGIEIPFPQQDVHVRSYFGLSGKAAIEAVAGQTALLEPAEPPQAQLTYRERRELESNDAVEDTLQAIEQDKQEKAEAEQAAAAEQSGGAPTESPAIEEVPK